MSSSYKFVDCENGRFLVLVGAGKLDDRPATKGELTATAQEVLDAAKNYTDTKVVGIYRFKGSVPTYADLLAIEDPENGDVWDVQENGKNYAWNGSEWDDLGGFGIPDDVFTASNVKAGTNITIIEESGEDGPEYTISASANTYNEFPAEWHTNTTFSELLADIFTDPSAVPGMAYLGKLTCSEMPMTGNVETIITIQQGPSTKSVHVMISSGTDAPYKWEYTAWNYNSTTHTYTGSGWVGFQLELEAGDNVELESIEYTLPNSSIKQKKVRIKAKVPADVFTASNVRAGNNITIIEESGEEGPEYVINSDRELIQLSPSQDPINLLPGKSYSISLNAGQNFILGTPQDLSVQNEIQLRVTANNSITLDFGLPNTVGELTNTGTYLYRFIYDSDSLIWLAELLKDEPVATDVSVLAHFNNNMANLGNAGELVPVSGVNPIYSDVKFGGGIGSSVSQNSSVKLPDSDTLDLGTGDFTIDAWVKMTGNTGFNNSYHGSIIGEKKDNCTNYNKGLSAFKFYYGYQKELIFGSVSDFVKDVSYHIAVARKSGVAYGFVNGILKATTNSLSGVSISIKNWFIATAYTSNFRADVSELRIIKGRAVWTSDFSVPNKPYTLDATLPKLQDVKIQKLESTKQDTLIAGTNISIASDGKTISAIDTTYSPFTGSDGSDAGTSGLVPAPAAADNTKFLSGDGTWKVVESGTNVDVVEGEVQNKIVFGQGTPEIDWDNLQVGMRLDEKASFVTYYTDGDNQKYAVFVLDAQYRSPDSMGWGPNELSGLTVYPDSTDLSKESGNPDSATKNTDYIINTYYPEGTLSNPYPTFKFAHDAATVTIGGSSFTSKLPNKFELYKIWYNRVELDSFDPTVSDYSNRSLTNWRGTWSCYERNQGYAWTQTASGGTDSWRKYADYNAVIPVFEIPLPIPQDEKLFKEINRIEVDGVLYRIHDKSKLINTDLSSVSATISELDTNSVYQYGVLNSLTITALPQGYFDNRNKYDESIIYFTSGASGTTISLPNGLTWLGGTAPTIANNTKYVMSICNGIVAIGPTSGGGGGSFDPTAIDGYDDTEEQVLINETGSLKWVKYMPVITWYTGTGTSLTISDTTYARLVKVYKNGILLQEGAGNDYTISGTTLTLSTALTGTDKITTEVYE